MDSPVFSPSPIHGEKLELSLWGFLVNVSVKKESRFKCCIYGTTDISNERSFQDEAWGGSLGGVIANVKVRKKHVSCVSVVSHLC